MGVRFGLAGSVALVLSLVAACSDDGAAPGDTTAPVSATTAAEGGPVRVVVDTDLAQDDLIALSFLLSSDQVQVEAVTVTGAGEVTCPRGVEIARGLLAITGDEDVPVACGRTTPHAGDRAFPAEWRQAADDAYGLDLPDPGEAAAGDGPTAVELLRETLAPGGVTLLTLGPLTNVAEAFREDPGLAAAVGSIVVMGGAVDVGGNVYLDDTTTPVAEWNVYVDPTAAAEVVASGVPVVLVGLDATNEVPITPAFLDILEANAHEPAAALVYQLLSENPFVTSGESFFWDPLAAAVVHEPGLVSTETVELEVVTQEGAEIGRTVRRAGGAPVAVADGANAGAFYGILVRTLDGLAPGEPFATLPPPVAEATIRFDGTTCTYEGPASVPVGRMVFRFETAVEGAGAVVVHLIGEATIDEALAWVVANPTSEGLPPMIDRIDYVEPGGTATVRLQPGNEAVACGSGGGLPIVAATFTVTEP